MSLRRPTDSEIRSLGEDLYLNLTEDEIEDFRELVAGVLDSYETVREYGQPEDEKSAHMGTIVEPGRRVRENDPYNAWITKCKINGSESGPLSGYKIGIKDNIAVAGVEMTCGSQVMEGYVPAQNATVVDRLLEAGGDIVGKTNMDDLAFTGNGHSSAFGPTLNPQNDDHLSGGSSGGSAIAVATDEVDVALGGDQGGSIRAPAAWTGVVGHKPTHGLVPYTGCVGIENTIDHVGPLAPNVETAARTLSVIAGDDPKDPRQPASVPTEQFEDALDGSISSLSIAVISEGFDRPESSEAVNEHVWDALDRLAAQGATVEEFSMPMHTDAQDIYTVALAEGFLAAVAGEGVGHNWKGWYNVSWIENFGKYRRAQGGDLPPSVKLTLLAGAYTSEQYHSKYYAEAMNLRQELARLYDEQLDEYDLVAMPTTPQLAHKWIPDQDRFEFIADSWTNLANTCVFNMTGHPSLSVPVNPVDELPVGLMLTGSYFDDATVLNAGYTVEQVL